jgi:hypothetical protein
MSRTRAFAAASFLIPFVLYLATMCPTVHLGDSGELNLAAATLGIPHAPGYPLLATVGHLVCRLPFGNGAMRGNLFSAIAGALACFLLFLLLNRQFRRPVMSFAFSMGLAASFTLWEQSLKIRAYPLNTAFAIGVIYLTLRWREKHDRRLLLAMAFLLGLGMANHEILLVVCAVPLVLMIADIRSLRVTDVAVACVFGLIGLSVYGYLPIRAMADPVLNWGDPQTLDRFLDVLLQRQYAGKMMSADWGPKLVMIGMIVKAMLTEFGPLVALLGFFGFFVAWTKDRALTIGLVLLVLFNIALRINYIGEHEFHQVLRYMISSFVVFLFFAAYMADVLIKAIEKSALTASMRKTLVILIAVGIALPPFIASGAKNDLANHRVGYEFIQSTLMAPEPGYVIAVGGDNNVFPLWYLQRFERFREDVVVIPNQGFRAQWLADEIAAQLPDGMTEPSVRYAHQKQDARFYSTLDRLIYSGFPVYSLFESTTRESGIAPMADLKERFGLAPCGLMLRFGPPLPHCAPDAIVWSLFPLDSMTDPSLYRDFHTLDLLDNVSTMLTKRALAFADQGEPGRAIAILADAIQVLPEEPWPWMNLANLLAKTGRPEKALEIYDQLITDYPDEPIYLHNRSIIEKHIKQKGKP